jgi:2-ketoarginine methyltransferase
MSSNVISNEFLPGLEKSLGYLRGFAASQVIYSFLQEGIFSLLEDGLDINAIAQKKGYDPNLLRTVFEYLAVEGILEKSTSENGQVNFQISNYGKNISTYYQGWFNLLIGGYSSIFANITNIMSQGTNYVSRNGKWVGVGACQISQNDVFPLAKKMMEEIKPNVKTIVDYGCGSALGLCEFCNQNPNIKAIGVEPDEGAYQAGLNLVAAKKLQERITLVNSAALDHEINEVPDFILFWFVLQEIYGQNGEAALIEFIKNIGVNFPDSYLHVIEVDYAIDNEEVMKSPLGLGFYNPYFLLHPFTDQKLVSDQKWTEIFTKSGFEIIKKEAVDPKVDPTGLVIGYVLKYAEYGV